MAEKFIIMPNTEFLIFWDKKELWELDDDGKKKKVDWSKHVINWDLFNNIIRNGHGDEERLVVKINANDHKSLAFFNFMADILPGISVDLLIDCSSFKSKEGLKMDENKVIELTSEEKIEQLEKEKAELEQRIERQKIYESFKKGADDTALLVKAYQDSGFSREEAMSLVIAAIGTIPHARLGSRQQVSYT